MLILDNPVTWPKHIVEKLNSESVIQLCNSHEFIDDIADDPIILNIFEDVETYAGIHGLAGYHCTKQLLSSPFSSTGLRVLNFQNHHAWFRNLIRHYPDIDDEFYQYIDNKLTHWQNNHTGKRENMIWFCLTRALVLDSGTKSFFKYFGGEAIYFTFKNDERVAPILESIGEPVVIETKIDATDLTVFHEWAFGRTLVSHFAHSINSKFFIENLEGYISVNIEPNSIIATHPYNQFITSLTLEFKTGQNDV
ncbi:hypothetical protein DENIS_0699 [Desulfonema ishimotonii]|uniref:Uncharacterized protein n=1 Tax=Desulfonema ishimotonii TaxID=45657 RepID=A0A401FS23_9BACT|nr:hypothetical protein [Desulfonema ishimotonii]GBC59758.1 hypothetical protein DENIS_0699 [Desulfonema ishimotonii]